MKQMQEADDCGAARLRLAIVVSHPIQYYAPLYRALARDPGLDLRVFFASRIGQRKMLDREMGVAVAWAVDLTAGYAHEYLPGADAIDHVSFFTINNSGVFAALDRFAPQATILHGYALPTMLRALVWSRWRGVPALMISDSSSHVAQGGLRRRIKDLVVPWLLRQFAAMLTWSERSERHLASLGVDSSRLFRTPALIVDGFWAAREHRAALRAERRRDLGLGEADFVFACVGKLYAGKRVADSLAALARVRADRRVVLLIAGDGEDRAALEQQARELGVEAIFLGFVNIDALPGVYAAADALVHAAEFEQYGMVLVEAAVVGLPLIVSDRVGGVGATSVARPDINTLVFPCGDVEALSLAMRRFVDDRALFEAMGAASREISEIHRGERSVAAVKAALARALARNT